MGIVSEKLSEHGYLIKCYVLKGAFSEEVRVFFPAYDSDGNLGIEGIVCHPEHIDEEQRLCRTDLIKIGDKASVDINGETYRVPLDSIVLNH